jgi:hypothetical protein
VTDHTIRIPIRTARSIWDHRQWEASVGAHQAEGTTLTEAKTNLAALVEAALAIDEEPLVLAFGDYVSVSTLHPMGWIERTYERNTATSQLTRRGSCGGRPVPRAEQEARVRMSLAQRVTEWENDVSVVAGAAFCVPDHDDVGFCSWCRSCFLSYAAWQRAAAFAIANAETCGTNYHMWAHDHAKEFTVLV